VPRAHLFTTTVDTWQSDRGACRAAPPCGSELATLIIRNLQADRAARSPGQLQGEPAPNVADFSEKLARFDEDGQLLPGLRTRGVRRTSIFLRQAPLNSVRLADILPTNDLEPVS
jgi:hypothetical protein